MRRPIVAVAGGDPTTIERQGGYEKTPNVHVFTNLRDSVQFGSRSKRHTQQNHLCTSPR